MSKSSKKRRDAAKRRQELDKLRGVALLDSASPGPCVLPSSPNPGNASHLKSNGKDTSIHTRQNGNSIKPDLSKPVVLPMASLVSRKRLEKAIEADLTKPIILPMACEVASRKRVEFVLPKSLGKAETYIFDKQTIDEELPTIREESEPDGDDRRLSSNNESIEDILFPTKKRKLEEKFEAASQEKSKESKDKTSVTAPSESPGPGKKKKRKKRVSLENIVPSGKPDNHDSKEGAETTTADTANKASQSNIAVQHTGSKAAQSNISTQHNNKNHKHGVAKSEANGGTLAVSNKSEPKVRPKLEFDSGQISGRSVEEAVKDKHGLRPRANSTDGELNLPQGGLCDERMVLQAHRWNDDKNYVHQMTPKGFVNLGNTCFLNSTLQCLAYLPPFCQSLFALSEAKMKQQNGQKLSQGQKMTSYLCSLFQKIHGFNGNSIRDGAIAPQAIVRALPTIGSCGSRNGYKFRPGRQEDSHEFLVHLLDAMHDGELRAAGINQHASGWRDRLPAPRLDETTFIHRIFCGYFRSQVRCSKCGYRSNTYDPFLDLSLEVSKKSSNSVLYALSEFTRKETLDSANQWKCTGCKKYVCATKELTVFRPPLSLCIQLKRFTFGTGLGGRGCSSYGTGGWKYGKGNAVFRGGTKITKPIEFPAELKLPLSDGRSCEYALTGIIIHVGGSASSGHYTAYVKKPGRKGGNQWYHADDSFVEPVSEKTVLRQKDAYVLFYCRKEVKLEFPSPPPRGMSAEEAKEFGRARAKARADSVTKEEVRKKIGDDRLDSKETASANSSGKTFPALESVKVQDGTVKRVKTKIHPLASPPPSVPQSREGCVTSATAAPARGEHTAERRLSTPELDNRTDTSAMQKASSRASFPPDVTTVTSSQLREYMLKRTSVFGPEPQAGSKYNNDLLNHERRVEKRKDPPASSSNDDESSSDEEKDPVPLKGSGNNEESSGTSSGSDSVSSTSAAAIKKAEKKQTSDSNSSSDSSSSEEQEENNGARSSKVARQVPNFGEAEKERLKKGKSDAPAKHQDVKLTAETGGKSDTESSSDDSDSDDDDSSTGDGSHGSSSQREPRSKMAKAASHEDTARTAAVKDSNRTRVVLGRADSRGKVQVMLGPRKKRTWTAKARTSEPKGAGFELLGNLGVSRWDEEEDDDGGNTSTERRKAQEGRASHHRNHIVAKMDKQDRSRKRKMHLDRWDALLDQGKTKKMKLKSESQDSFVSQNPKKNVFQRIQSGIQKMNRGKAKGFFRRGTKDSKASKRSF